MGRHQAAIMVIACAAAGIGTMGCGSGSSGGPRSISAASCVGPQLTLSDNAAAPGAAVAADGEWFAADCYDTGQPGQPPALTGLTVSIAQNGKTWPLATGVDAAGDHYTFHVPLILPTDLTPGDATVRVDGYGTAATLHITRS